MAQPWHKRTKVAALLATALAGVAFSPLQLFGNNTQQGWWYDPSDFSTMYQDSAGTTPVTAVEQPVGLQLDKRYGLVRGSEQAAATYATGTGSDNITTATSATSFTTTAGTTACRVYLNLTGAASSVFEVTFRITAISSGTMSFVLRNAPGGGGSSVVTVYGLTVGTYTYRLGAPGVTNPSLLWVNITNGTTFAVDSISVREIPGTHRLQATAASRPTLSARYNLLTNTAFSGAAAGTPGTAPTNWTLSTTGSGSIAIPASGLTLSALSGGRQLIYQQFTLAANASYTYSVDILAASGDQTANNAVMLVVVSAGALSSVSPPVAGYYASDGIGRKTVTMTAGAAGATVTVRLGVGCGNNITADSAVSFANPDFRLTADATGKGPTYQRVNTATDYDTAGFLHYLKYDGVDDSMATASTVDFSATDKVTLFAGVTKLSDAAAGVVCELSASVTANNGSFYLLAPNGASPDYATAMKGTIAVGIASPASYAAPNTQVVTALGNIASASTVLRVGGAQVNSSSNSLGTGNLGNYTAYFGRRGGSTLPFNGREYSNICLGRLASEAEIAKTERWVNARTGAWA